MTKHRKRRGPKPKRVPRTLTDSLVAGWKCDGTDIEVKLENRTRSKELLMKHLGFLKEHVQLEVASELTLEEEERLSKMSDEELAEFNEANETIERLLVPPLGVAQARRIV